MCARRRAEKEKMNRKNWRKEIKVLKKDRRSDKLR